MKFLFYFDNILELYEVQTYFIIWFDRDVINQLKISLKRVNPQTLKLHYTAVEEEKGRDLWKWDGDGEMEKDRKGGTKKQPIKVLL